jgi:hypothetical protein
MNDLLIFKLREPNRIGGKLMNEAADAIEKLEAENAQLKQDNDCLNLELEILGNTSKAYLADRDALKAELAAMREQNPVAWGWKKSNGVIYDTICAEEHDRHEGEYLTPLYTAPGAKP